MRKMVVLCMLWFALPTLPSIIASQEQVSELPVVIQLETENSILDLDWNFDNTLLAFKDGDDGVSIINVETGEINVRLDNNDEIFVIGTIGWHSTKNHLLVTNNLTKIWDYPNNVWLDDFEFPSGLEFVEYSQGSVDWHPIENRFSIHLRGCIDGTPFRPGARVEVWNVTDSSFFQIGGCVGSIIPKWNPQGTQLAISGIILNEDGFVESSEIQIWNVNEKERILTINDLTDPSGLSWNPRGNMIAFTTVIDNNRIIQVRDVSDGEIIVQTTENLGFNPPLDWHPTENFIVTGGQDGSVKIWDALDGSELVELFVHEDTIHDVGWSPDGSMLASAGRDGRLFVWSLSELLEQQE